jgi:hypothetical protein
LFAPAARIEVIILYFYVVLHKINYDFLNTIASCAVDHSVHLSKLVARVIGRDLFPDADLVRMAVIAATLIVEAAIPLLLLHHRTRNAGVALGLLFHYLLGINIFHDFSGMIFALYLLFLPSNFAERTSEWWKQVRARVRVSVFASLPGRAAPPAVWLTILVIGILLVSGNSWRMLHRIFFCIWVIYGLALIAIFAAVVHTQRSRFLYVGREFHSHAALLIVPVLVFLNGTAPYLGLKTEHSFAMFSNLRTEGGKSNHLLLPASLQLFDFQKDLVTITHSSANELRYIVENQTAVPYFVLRNQISSLAEKGEKNIEVVYRRAGVEHALKNAELDPELSVPYPWAWRKFLLFREVDTTEQQMCRH